ncbi:MAG: flippase-like domain-containing protein [Thermomicrobiales bacterium]|nr:flippase-like domain-containing protein [Thermomicrobiales bacterium]
MSIVSAMFRRGLAFGSRYGIFIWLTLFLGLTVAFISRQRSEIQQIGTALSAADSRWLVGLLAFQVITLALAGLTYKVILRRLGHDVRLHELVDLHLQRHVVGTLTPVGGPASIYVLIRNLGRRGIPADDALLTTTLRSATGYASFVLLLVPTFLVHRPSGIALVGAAILLGMLIVLLTAITLLLRSGRHGLPRLLPERLTAFVDNARHFQICPRDLLAPFGVGLLYNLANAAGLFIALRAMHQDVSPVVVLVGFTAGTMFSLVAPVFQGIGLVEVSMAVALQQMGVPVPAAVGAALLFRLGDLWLPLLVGLVVQAGRQDLVRSTASRLPQVVVAIVGLGALLAGASDGTILPVFGSGSALGPSDLVSLLVAVGGAVSLVWAFSHVRPSERLRQLAVGNLAVILPVVGLLYIPSLVEAFSLFG